MSNSFIQNYQSLAVNDQRQHALEIINAGLTAVATDPAIRRLVQRQGENLTVGSDNYLLTDFHRILVVCIGKAAVAAAHTLEDILGPRISDGIVIDTRTDTFIHMRSFKGSHPYPSEDNLAATEQVWDLLSHCTEQDLVITVISGGGSALLFRPHLLSVDQVVTITKNLIKQAADIYEVNTVRKHISTVAGGQLAAHAHPATSVSLIFSDILGDDLSMVASGPTYPDSTTAQDAWQILSKYQAAPFLTQDQLRETPKDPLLFQKVHNYLVVNNQVAAAAMVKTAEALGYQTTLHSLELKGEARDVGRKMAEMPMGPKSALIAAGETTVTISGSGTGGRNLELSLGALQHLKDNALVVSCASDGIDNAMPAAGAIADSETRQLAQDAHLNASRYLKHNDSYPFFEKIDQLIITGPTGINIADLILVLHD